MSGKEIKERQFKNKQFKAITLFTFHFEISGNSFNNEQSLNNKDNCIPFRNIW